MFVTLYTTNCPKCNILKEKLTQKNIKFTEVTDEDFMIKTGINSIPTIELVNGTRYEFKDAVDWLKTLPELEK